MSGTSVFREKTKTNKTNAVAPQEIKRSSFDQDVLEKQMVDVDLGPPTKVHVLTKHDTELIPPSANSTLSML